VEAQKSGVWPAVVVDLRNDVVSAKSVRTKLSATKVPIPLTKRARSKADNISIGSNSGKPV